MATISGVEMNAANIPRGVGPPSPSSLPPTGWLRCLMALLLLSSAASAAQAADTTDAAADCGSKVRCIVFQLFSEGKLDLGDVLDLQVLPSTGQFRFPSRQRWSADTVLSAPIGGAPGTDIREYPAFLFVGDPMRCSGTAIGPRVILTSAHCVRNDSGNIRFFVQRNNTPYQLFCESHSKYKPPISGKCGVSTPGCEPDIAACWIEDSSVNLVAAPIALPSSAMPSGPLAGPTPRNDQPLLPAAGSSANTADCDKPVNRQTIDVLKVAKTESPAAPRSWPTTFEGRNSKFGICEGDSGSGFYTPAGAVAGVLSERHASNSTLTFQVATTAETIRAFLRDFQAERRNDAERPDKPSTPILWQQP